ncbi:MAG: TetR/AcrR family transcriptional regulator [Alphaproteobacteria bacterium]
MRDGTATKELIKRTALRLFAKKGITETTIRDIASAAKIAEGTMYRHYASKEDLAWSLFAENYTALGRELRRVQKRETTARRKLTVMIRYFCNVFERDADMFTYLFLARHRQMQKITPRMPNPYFVFRTVIKEGMVHGEIPREDPDVAASMVMGVILQVIDSSLLGQRIRPGIHRLADTIIAACLRVLKV